MSLCGLPHECLELILQGCLNKKGLQSLVCLLQVNKHLYYATLPFLYADPFRVHPLSPHNALYSSQNLKLVQTLLRKRQPGEISALLDAAYDVFPVHARLDPQLDHDSRESEMDVNAQEGSYTTATSAVPTAIEVDYLSYINNFYFEFLIFMPDYTSNGGNVRFDFKAYPERLVNWVSKSDNNPLYPPAFIEAYEPSWLLCYGTLAASIRRDLTWTLCSPVFEQIRQMMIPLSDMDRYLNAVERFKSLKEVTFKMDERWDDKYHADALHRAKKKGKKELRRLRDARYARLELMKTFVVRHQALFPNLLQKVDCPADTTWQTLVNCPEAICKGLKNLLLGVDRPTTICDSNIDDLADRIASMDLGLLKSVDLYDKTAVLMAKGPSFLSRCRALTTLSIDSPGPGSFAWAMKDKIAWETQMLELKKSAFSSSFQEWCPLILLESLTLRTLHGFKDEPDDVVRAFGSTLRVAGFLDYSKENEQGLEFRIGQDWHLPVAKVFTFFSGKCRLLVAPDMYTSVFGECLTRLSLMDMSSGVEVQDLYSCHPGRLPNLVDLHLKGWPALVFHPETLHHVPNLKSLSISLFSGMHPLEELLASFQQEPNLPLSDGFEEASQHSIGHRPMWTWDWYLPFLQNITFSSEFAYLFQFRMLVGCPSLITLALDIGSQQTYSRVLSLNDFIHVEGSLPDGDSSLPSTLPSSALASLTSPDNSPRLIKTKIEKLYLSGPWVLNDDLRDTVFASVFPDLCSLREISTSGYSLRGWLQALRKLSRLEETVCQPAEEELISQERLMEHGLVLVPSNGPLNGGDAGIPRSWPSFRINYRRWSFKGNDDGVAN